MLAKHPQLIPGMSGGQRPPAKMFRKNKTYKSFFYRYLTHSTLLFNPKEEQKAKSDTLHKAMTDQKRAMEDHSGVKQKDESTNCRLIVVVIIVVVVVIVVVIVVVVVVAVATLSPPLSSSLQSPVSPPLSLSMSSMSLSPLPSPPPLPLSSSASPLLPKIAVA